MKVKVNEGWQLAHEDGTPAQPGEIVEVDKATADQWIAAGMASKSVGKAKAVSSSKNKAVTSSPNKAEVTDASE